MSLSTLLSKFHNSFLVKGQLDALEECQAENNPTEPALANDDPDVMESNADAVVEEAGNTVPAENDGNESWIDSTLSWKLILVCTLADVKKMSFVDDFFIISYL